MDVCFSPTNVHIFFTRAKRKAAHPHDHRASLRPLARLVSGSEM